ncbi:MAG: RnfABCDGE type electron transport complex subunit B [Betaproteobacteria bacterium]|nr:MAG: RnfABCDGE type electron transport complex subunit B [Betaproteobacteria bacterium]TMH03578.1 MAG: RnfABCDGE type electron transport complex subunit B [Betaproteobacteria bacterium]
MSEPASLAARIDALLPQTQCRRCGFEGCRPYAEAVAAGTAPINRCPPGGDATIAALSRMLGHPRLPLDPACGPEAPLAAARIDEPACIGCTLCIAACPVDAIIGAAKLMHTVLRDSCTGCELCLPVCPVDCIVMRPSDRAWTADDAMRARERYDKRNIRIASHSRRSRSAVPAGPTRDQRRAAVAAAFARARARRRGGNGSGG